MALGVTNYPTALDDNTTLLAADNKVSTTLNGAIDAVVTSITLTDASRFPSTGGVAVIESELLSYTGKTGNTLNGVTRGLTPTSAATHSTLVTIKLVIGSQYHNSVKDAVVAIETELGTLPKGSFGSVKARLDSMESGNLFILKLPTTDAINTIQPSAATIRALTIKGFAAQSDSLLEFHDSAGVVLAKFDATGTLSIPGGAGSERFGSGSLAAGTNALALGNAASASGASAVAIGKSALASIVSGIAIGASAVASTGTGNIAIGTSASVTCSGGASVALGGGAVTDSIRNVIIGDSSSITGAVEAVSLEEATLRVEVLEDRIR